MERIGTCWKCGAEMYRTTEGKVVSASPAPGCLCEVRIQDLPLKESYEISLSRDEILQLVDGTYVEVEAVVEEILDQVRRQTEV